MPLKRRTSKQHSPPITLATLLPHEIAFLFDEKEPADPEHRWYGHWWAMERDDDPAFRPDRPPVADMWAELGEGIVAEWAQERPGSRPSCWWRYQAPEPRRRLGGVGSPGWPDRLQYRPSYRLAVATGVAARRDDRRRPARVRPERSAGIRKPGHVSKAPRAANGRRAGTADGGRFRAGANSPSRYHQNRGGNVTKDAATAHRAVAEAELAAAAALGCGRCRHALRVLQGGARPGRRATDDEAALA